MRLGKLALRKLAQLPDLQGGMMSDIRQGQYPSQVSTGPSAQQLQGMTTGAGLVQGGLQSALGDVGGLAGMFLQPYLPALSKYIGVDLTKPLQYAYGGDPDAFVEQQRAVESAMQAQMQNQGETASKVLGGALEFMKDKWGVNTAPVKQILSNMPPAQVGMFMQSLSGAFPQINTLMSRLDPGFISDFSPIVKATRLRNNNKFDPKVFNQTLGDFQRSFQRGEFEGVPAQVAMNAMTYAIENYGGSATPEMAANVAQAADAYVRSGLAPSFGEAITLVEAIDPQGKTAIDPSKAIGYANYLDNLAEQGFVNKEHIYQAAQYARQKGISPITAMTGVAQGGRVKRQLGGGGDAYADAAADTMARAGQSDNIKLLAAMHQAGSRGQRNAIENAMKSGDARKMFQLVQRARYNPELMQKRHYVDTGSFLNEMGTRNPRLLQGFATQEMQDIAKRTGNRQLQGLLADPTELRKRLRTKDFSGLNTGTLKAISAEGPYQGRLAATALSSSPAALKGKRLIAPKTPVTPKTPERFGLQHPTSAPAAPASQPIQRAYQ